VMRAERIPYQIIGGVRFFERAEVKDLLSYLRVVANPRSDVDLLRIINKPSRKLGDTTLDKLVQMADGRSTSLYDSIEALCASGSVNAGTRHSLQSFRDLLQKLMKAARDMRPSQLAELVLTESGYLKMLDADDSTENEARKQNLSELVGSLLDYEEEARSAGEEMSLSGYLERVTLSSDIDALEDAPRVAMMTVHAAKGLEFDSVFITGMEEDLFPFRAADPSRNEDVEEERRLAYVAVTRARTRLWITYAGRRMIFGQTRFGLPSRFITDLPRSTVRQGATPALERQQSSRESGSGSVGSVYARVRAGGSPWTHPQERASSGGANSPGRARAEPERAPGERYVERELDLDQRGGEDGAICVGGRVQHKTFGVGLVMSIDGGGDPVVSVKFSGYGVKRIKAAFLQQMGE
jgi:DNA helicase-2/ATP-dependent DNA helicase PcrA